MLGTSIGTPAIFHMTCKVLREKMSVMRRAVHIIDASVETGRMHNREQAKCCDFDINALGCAAQPQRTGGGRGGGGRPRSVDRPALDAFLNYNRGTAEACATGPCVRVCEEFVPVLWTQTRPLSPVTSAQSAPGALHVKQVSLRLPSGALQTLDERPYVCMSYSEPANKLIQVTQVVCAFTVAVQSGLQSLALI